MPDLTDDDGTVIGAWWVNDHEVGLLVHAHARLFHRLPLRVSLPSFRRGLSACVTAYDVPWVWMSAQTREAAWVLRRLGFHHVGTLPEYVIEQGQVADVQFFRLHRNEVSHG